MFTQFLLSHIENNTNIKYDEMIDHVYNTKEEQLSLGILAVKAGFMTVSQTNRVHEMQTKMDKRFGNIAMDLGYLTRTQLNELLKIQNNNIDLLYEALLKDDFMKPSELDSLIKSFNDKYEVDILKHNNATLDKILKKFYALPECEHYDIFFDYICLLINNIIRFIGDDFIPLNPEFSINSTSFKSLSQKIISKNQEYNISFFADELTLISFASRYSSEEIFELNEYVESATQDFLNLHNGLFTMKESKEKDIELTLSPPDLFKKIIPNDTVNSIILPFHFQFGTIRFAVKPFHAFDK